MTDDPTPLEAWRDADSVASLAATLAGFDAASLRQRAAVLRRSSTSPRATAHAAALDLVASVAEQAQPVAAALAEVAL